MTGFYPPSQKQSASVAPPSGPGVVLPRGGYFRLASSALTRFEDLAEARAAAKRRGGKVIVCDAWHRKVGEVG